MKPTAQQDQILEAVSTGDPLAVVAGAGTGKTTTLRLVTESEPNRKFVYLAYNKAIADESAGSFPRNTECRTVHSYAFRAVGSRYKHRLGGRMAIGEKTKILETKTIYIADGFEPLPPNMVTRLALGTVERFCWSADNQIMSKHVPFLAGLSDDDRPAFAQRVASYAQRAWGDITSDAGLLPFLHDYYLKMWQMTGPVLPGDVVMLDEAQDANPVISNIVERQPSQIILVGDPNQQIYQWRGAVDAMDRFPGKSLELSESFRFGPAIADEANKWLELLEARLRLTGLKHSTLMTLDQPDAVLCRTNAGVMSVAMDSLGSGDRPAVIGRIGGTVKSFCQAAADLKAGRRTSHMDLCLFPDWVSVQEYVETPEGADLASYVRMVDKHGVDVLLDAVAKFVPESQADVVIGTGHGAKGREWGTVRIHSDFVTAVSDDKKSDDDDPTISAADARLAYVVVTRAKAVLDLGGLSPKGLTLKK